MRGQTNTAASTASKVSAATASKRIAPAPNKPRLNSDITRVSSGATSIMMGSNSLESHYRGPIKIITEVDGMNDEIVCLKRNSRISLDTNIDEVLNLPDLSTIPISFLTEIQHDQVYETILEELRKKVPYSMTSKTLPVLQEEEQHQRKPFSPRLLAICDDDDDDDELSFTAEISSSSASENNDLPNQDDYDTDIEPGE